MYALRACWSGSEARAREYAPGCGTDTATSPRTRSGCHAASAQPTTAPQSWPDHQRVGPAELVEHRDRIGDEQRQRVVGHLDRSHRRVVSALVVARAPEALATSSATTPSQHPRSCGNPCSSSTCCPSGVSIDRDGEVAHPLSSCTVLPPSTTSTEPVTYDASREARKPTAAATSAGGPGPTDRRPLPHHPLLLRRRPVAIQPGSTALTVTPDPPTSTASARVSPTSPAFAGGVGDVARVGDQRSGHRRHHDDPAEAPRHHARAPRPASRGRPSRGCGPTRPARSPGRWRRATPTPTR